MPRFVLDKAIEDAKEVGTFGAVVFTGGEATLFMDDLLYGIRKSHELGFGTRVVTNAWWARSTKSADDYVGRLKAAGLDEINTSYDDYHAEFMGVENVYRFVESSLKHDLNIAVATVVDNQSKHTSQSIKEGTATYLGMDVAELAKRVVFLQDKATPAGRGRQLAETPGRIATYDKLSERIGCKEIGKTISIHPDGSVHLCCGHAAFDTDGLSVGNIIQSSLKSLMDRAHSNLLYWWIHMRGTNNILAAVGDPTKYATICDACLHIFTDRYQDVVAHIEKNRSSILLNDILLSDDPVTVASLVTRKVQDLASRPTAGPGSNVPMVG